MSKCACCFPPWQIRPVFPSGFITTRKLNTSLGKLWQGDYYAGRFTDPSLFSTDVNDGTGGEIWATGQVIFPPDETVAVRFNDSNGSEAQAIDRATSVGGWGCQALETDSAGSVYVATNASTPNEVIGKWNSAGVFQWWANQAGEVWAQSDQMSFDSNGDLCAVIEDSFVGLGRAIKINPATGVRYWGLINPRTVGEEGALPACQTDGTDIYVGGKQDTNPHNLFKLDTNGNVTWRHDTGIEIRAIDVLSSGDTVSGGISSTLSFTTSAGAANGTFITVLSEVYAIAVDGSDNIYVAGKRTGAVTLEKFNSAGVSQATFDHGDDLYGCEFNPTNGHIYVTGKRVFES